MKIVQNIDLKEISLYLDKDISPIFMMVETNTKQTNIISSIKAGGEKYLREIYETHRVTFLQWIIKNYSIDEELAAEVYQKAFITFYYNIKEGKLTELSSSIKTYLFAIGKNLVREHFKKSQKFVDDTQLELQQVDDSITSKYEINEKKQSIKHYLQKIGEPCKTVIELFYFRHYSMEAIAIELGYKDERIAAKRKFICLRQLKELMKTPMN